MTDERATPLARTQATAFCDNTFAKKSVGPLAEGGANREINVGRVPPIAPIAHCPCGVGQTYVRGCS